MTAAERLRARLRALLDKTVANGCTEAEALAAAEKARAIMAEHGLSKADLAMGQARAEEDTPARPVWHHTILQAAALCTNTAVVVERESYIFVGAEPGPEIAVYLRDVALRAVDTGVAEFRRSPAVAGERLFARRDRAERDFTAAFVERLAIRLVEIFAPQRNDAARRRALVHRDALFPGVPVHSPRRRTRDARALAAGAAAADEVALHHGVRTGAGPTAMIGARA
ncbi:MAG: DUF7168 domain-containing protein [Janthinobacterium lividum]